jgi:hypothetical protein
MDKKLILITTIAILVYLISLNYETVKTKLLNFKALILGRNPTSPPVTTTLPPVTTTSPPVTTTLPPVTTTLPPVTTTSPPGKIPVKNIVGGNRYSTDVQAQGKDYYISSIIDNNIDTVYFNMPSLIYGKQPPLHYIFTFNFNTLVKINKIILHSVYNLYLFAKKVILYKDQKTALDDANYGIQTFDIVSDTTNGSPGKYWGDATGPNAADFKSELLLSSPYIGDSITLRIYPNNLPPLDWILIREIEFFA